MKNETNNGYWNSTHPRAFENMEVRANHNPHYIACPKCHGHGAWHLSHYPNTRKDAYAYFDASCAQCFGWGYVDPNTVDATCIHEWRGSLMQSLSSVVCKRVVAGTTAYAPIATRSWVLIARIEKKKLLIEKTKKK